MRKTLVKRMQLHGSKIMNKGDMMELMNKYKLWTIQMFVLMIFFGFSCAIKRNFHQTGQEYCSLCMNLYTGQDTVQLTSNKICIFENDTVRAIGEIKNGERKGYWYIYRQYPDIFECSKVIRYKNGDSAVVWSRGMINQT